MAASFVRCEDPALLAQAVAAPAAEQLQLRALAPTVAVSSAPIAEVLVALRAADVYKRQDLERVRPNPPILRFHHRRTGVSTPVAAP